MSFRRRASVCCLCLVGLLVVGMLEGAAAPTVESETPAPIPSQIGEDQLERHQPLRPRTPSDQDRVDAAAWYMAGRLKEHRNDFRGAYDAYRKAAELDPNAATVYRELVRLAFSLNEVEDGIKYGMRAIEINPDDVELLRSLGVNLAAQGRSKFGEAVRLLEQATQVETLDRQSASYVMLVRALALLYSEMGENEKAAESYEVIFDARQHPEKYKLDARVRSALSKDRMVSYERIGVAFLNANRPQDAIKALELAAKSRGGKPSALNFSLARVYFMTDQHDKALAEIQKYLDAQLQSQGRAAYELLAEILQKTEQQDELIPRLEELAEKDSRNTFLQFFLADQYVDSGNVDSAEAIYKKLLEDSNEPEGYLGLAKVYRVKKQPADLLDALVKAFENQSRESARRMPDLLRELAADTETVDSIIVAARKQAEDAGTVFGFTAAVLVSQLADDADRDEAVVEFYRHGLKVANSRQADFTYRQLGAKLMDLERYEEAAAVFKEAVERPELDRSREVFMQQESRALEFAGKTDEALAVAKTAREARPDDPMLHYQVAWVNYHARRWEAAISEFEKIIKRFGPNPEYKPFVRQCQFSLSNIYVQTGRREQGESILEKVLEEDPKDPSVNNDLGYLWAEQGKNLERAEKMIRLALASDPENMAYLDSMGWVLYMTGKYAEALPFLVKASKMPGGDDATILDHLADCHHKLEQTEKAIELWTQALKQAKSDPSPDPELLKKIEAKLNANRKPE